MEQQPSFSRIIGGTQEQRNAFEKEAEEKAVVSGEEVFGEELLEPTEEEKKLIEQAVAYSNSIAASYGSTRTIDPQRVFVLREKAITRLTEGDVSGGVHSRLKQITGVERKMSPIVFAMNVVHEACHGASYSSAQILRNGTDLPYRQGISMRDKNGESTYFKQAEEAIVTVLARRFHDEILAKDPRYQEEISRTNEIKLWLASYIKKKAPAEKQKGLLNLVDDMTVLPNNEKLHQMISDTAEDEDAIFGYFQRFYENDLKSGSILRERSKERQVFEAVLEKISNQSGETVSSQELFDDFIAAHFTGNYLPLAKKIEGIMGQGSFREIAKELGIHQV